MQIKDSGTRHTYEGGATRDAAKNKGRFDLNPFEGEWRMARVMEEGLKKYGPRNWEKGMPVSLCLSKAKSHLARACSGFTDEDHLGMAIWNLMTAVTIQHRCKAGVLDPKWDDSHLPVPEIPGYEPPKIIHASDPPPLDIPRPSGADVLAECFRLFWLGQDRLRSGGDAGAGGSADGVAVPSGSEVPPSLQYSGGGGGGTEGAPGVAACAAGDGVTG